jgi:ABC-2 type transport system permease protein
MRKLLRIEQIKLLNYVPFQLLIALYVVAIVLGLIIYPLVDKQIPIISLTDLFRFPDVWAFLTWITEPYNVLLALIVIMITTNEFSNHTFKTQVIFGLARKDLVTQKFMLIFLLALFATLLIAITSVILGLTYSYRISLQIALENSWMLLTYFLSSFTYMVLGLFFALVIKNTALSILSFIGYRSFLEPVLFLIFREDAIRWFLPARATTKLTPLPNLIEIFQQKMNAGEQPEDLTAELMPGGLPLWGTILVVIGYVTLLVVLSYRLMNRKRLT